MRFFAYSFSFDYYDLVWISLVLSHLGFTQHFESEPLCCFAKFRKLSALFLGIFFSAPPSRSMSIFYENRGEESQRNEFQRNSRYSYILDIASNEVEFWSLGLWGSPYPHCTAELHQTPSMPRSFLSAWMSPLVVPKQVSVHPLSVNGVT